jgi:hypothetical protein
MKRLLSILLLNLLVITVATAVPAEEADVTIAKVRMRNPLKLDAKARAEVAAAAARIKKKRTIGVVKVRGNFPGAESAEEYLTRSVFMAREVETYLKSLLPAKIQVFVTASGYPGASTGGDNAVEIILYPHQLRLEEMESLRFVSTQANPIQTAPVTEPVTEEAAQPEPAPAGDAGLLSAPGAESGDQDVVSKKERDKRSSEDATLAEELVKKAKARAAERAKRNATEN